MEVISRVRVYSEFFNSYSGKIIETYCIFISIIQNIVIVSVLESLSEELASKVKLDS